MTGSACLGRNRCFYPKIVQFFDTVIFNGDSFFAKKGCAQKAQNAHSRDLQAKNESKVPPDCL